MRRVRYSVAMSLDGYIAGPNGEVDWILRDPDIDFPAIFRQFDTLLVGRRTFELMAAAGQALIPGMKTVVFSRTLRQADHPGVLIRAEDALRTVTSLKTDPGKDIWLFGGGALFRSLAAAGLVDTVEVSIVPTLLGSGVPFAPDLPKQIPLSLKNQKVYRSGIVSLEYAIT